MSIDIDSPETYECPDCKATIDPDVDDCRWSNVKDEWYCYSCFESDTQYSSTVVVVDGSSQDKYYVADAFVFDEYGDEPSNGLTFTRTYTSTSGWRGYYTTSINGPSGDWVDVLDGWTTGSWGDPIADRKARFNDWAEQIIEGELIPPCAVAIVSDPTSNVFSTAITVLVPSVSVNSFRDWLGEDADYLHNALS